MATANQKHAIVLIEKYTGIKYKGKQIKCANNICRIKHIKHNCKTKLDYLLFIQEHLQDYIK